MKLNIVFHVQNVKNIFERIIIFLKLQAACRFFNIMQFKVMS